MAKFWNDFSKWLEDASKVLSKEAGDLTLRGKLKLEIFDLKRRLNEQFTELGRNFYEKINWKKIEDLKKNIKIKTVITKIRKLQKDIKNKESDYKKIGGKK